MPQLNASNIDAVLSNISVAYVTDQTKYIANKVFPVVPVNKMSGLYYTYKREDWLRDEAKKRADATESAGSGYNLGSDSYSCDVYAFHKDVGDQIVANTSGPLQPMSDATRFVTSRLLLKQEVDFSATFFKTGVWGSDQTGVAGVPGANEFRQFSDYVNSDPLLAVEAAKDKVALTTGFECNTMVMGRSVFQVLKNHPDITDRIKYTSSENITEGMLARFFGVDRLFIGSSLVNTAKEGLTESLSANFGKGILLTHTAPSPGLLTPSAGYTFSWDGVSDGAGLSIGTYKFYMEQLRATRVESQSAWANKLVAADLGVYMTTVVA